MRDESLRIGQLSRRAGVPIDTIRYYEKVGLLRPAERTPSGYRSFDSTALPRLRFVRRAQELGFSLAEIAELLDLRLLDGSSCDEVRARAKERLATIEQKLERLERMRSALVDLIEACDERAPLDECPILAALGREDSDEPES